VSHLTCEVILSLVEEGTYSDGGAQIITVECGWLHMIVEYAVRAGHPVCMISNHNFTMPSADTHLLATVFTTIASATVIVYRCQVIMKCQDF